MTAVPVRAGPEVGATLTVIEPLPVPSAGASVIHSTLLAAIHGHDGVVVIATELLPPAGTALKATVLMA